MRVSDIYKTGGRSLSFEIFPPKKDSDLDNIDETLDVLCELKPDFISVTFGAGGSSNCNKTIKLAQKIKEKYKVEPVVHLTCLHYDRAEIDCFAHALKEAGVENVLALRGDHRDDIPMKNDFLYSSDLAKYLSEKYDFCVLGACYPECHPESDGMVDEIKHLKAKVNAGAEILISQLFFDNDAFFSFREKCEIADINVPILPGIMPVVKAAQIRRMVSMCNATFPERFQRIIDRYEDNKEALFDAGMSYALSQIIDLLVSDTAGIHLYTMNDPRIARRICEGIKNIV
ncbi:5,10-methylenetetrahydrofolate reductase (NAD(P)) [Eubacterium ruminantium]|nr:5,10-methylenetetrahydrofolate reductase (NAD(P)) [Eubacterium ruminantium]